MHGHSKYFVFFQVVIERLDGRFGDCDNGVAFDRNYDLKHTRRVSISSVFFRVTVSTNRSDFTYIF